MMSDLLFQSLSSYLFSGFYIIDSFQNDDDFLVGLLLMGALFFLLALIIGTALVIIFFLILFFLVSGGILSASVLVGLQQRSVSKGFKTLFLSISILGSTIISVIFFLIVNSINDWWENEVAVFAGIVCGAFSGWLLGILIFKATKKLAIFIKDKYTERANSKITR